MNIEQFLKFASTYRKGSFASIVTEREGKTLKSAAGMSITKRSEMVVRFGVDYENLKQTGEKRETGELPSENQGLPWGQWALNGALFPYVIEHKGNYYLRCYANRGQIKTTWFLNGEPVKKSEIAHYLQASEKKPCEDAILTMSVKASNIRSIGDASPKTVELTEGVVWAG